MIDVDTTKLKKSGEDLVKLSNDLSDLCNSLYSRLYNIPYKTHEWLGISANTYSDKAILDKRDMVNFKNTLYEFGKNMIDIANSYNNEVKK